MKFTNRPAFFETFAATLKHEELGPGQSKTTYIYNFQAKPRWLAWLLEPIMNVALKKEINMRLKALKGYVEGRDG